MRWIGFPFRLAIGLLIALVGGVILCFISVIGLLLWPHDNCPWSAVRDVYLSLREWVLAD